MIGTLVNVLTIIIGSAIGVAVGTKIPHRTRTLITDALGLVTFIRAQAPVPLYGIRVILMPSVLGNQF